MLLIIERSFIRLRSASLGHHNSERHGSRGREDRRRSNIELANCCQCCSPYDSAERIYSSVTHSASYFTQKNVKTA